jgi:hypothetical protein
MVRYGYQLPQLLPDEKGRIVITKEMFLKAEQEEMTIGIMDHKGDYSLNRYVRIRVPGRSEALRMANARASSGWPILDFEKELYGSMQALISAYAPGEDIAPMGKMVDLARKLSAVDVEFIISVS